jgi:hypothetical protein
MRFRRHKEGEQVFNSMFPGKPAMLMYYCNAGDWRFIISYDTLHSVWSATYQPIHPKDNRVSSTPCDSPPPGKQAMFYDTQNEAEKACERKYRQLRKDN